jgi:hypothetical protein
MEGGARKSASAPATVPTYVGCPSPMEKSIGFMDSLVGVLGLLPYAETDDCNQTGEGGRRANGKGDFEGRHTHRLRPAG